MSKKRSIALKLFGMPYSEVLYYGKKIHEGLANNVATYPVPAVSLADQLIANDNLQLAIEIYGVTGNRGSRLENVTLNDACEVVRGNLKRLANYCEAVTPNDVTNWVNVGFTPKQLPAKAGVSAAPSGVVQVYRRNTLAGSIHLVWEKPLETIRRRTLTYKVMRSATADFSNAVVVGTTTKRFFIDTPPLQGEIYYYWIIPMNSYGEGVASPMAVAIAQKTIVQFA